MTKEEVLKSVPKLEQLYVIFSRLTHLPYIECDKETFDDEVFAFTEEDKAIARARELAAENRPSIAIKVDKKNMLRIFSEFYAYGVNAIVLAAGDDVFHVQLDEIIRRPDLSGIPEAKRPLENPQLQLSMIYYMQEVRRKVENPDRARYKELEEEMLVNVMRSKYLIPFREVEGEDGKKGLQLIFLKINENPMIPVFSDGAEYNRFRGEQNFKVAVTDFERMAKMKMPEQAKGFIVNPSGVGVPLPQDYMKRLLQNYSWK